MLAQQRYLRLVWRYDYDPAIVERFKKADDIRILEQKVLDNSYFVMVSVTEVVEFFMTFPTRINEQERSFNKGCPTMHVVAGADLVIVKSVI